MLTRLGLAAALVLSGAFGTAPAPALRGRLVCAGPAAVACPDAAQGQPEHGRVRATTVARDESPSAAARRHRRTGNAPGSVFVPQLEFRVAAPVTVFSPGVPPREPHPTRAYHHPLRAPRPPPIA